MCWWALIHVGKKRRWGPSGRLCRPDALAGPLIRAGSGEWGASSRDQHQRDREGGNPDQNGAVAQFGEQPVAHGDHATIGERGTAALTATAARKSAATLERATRWNAAVKAVMVCTPILAANHSLPCQGYCTRRANCLILGETTTYAERGQSCRWRAAAEWRFAPIVGETRSASADLVAPVRLCRVEQAIGPGERVVAALG